MTIVFAFCNKDSALALLSAKVITSHGINMRHEAAILCTDKCGKADAIHAELLKAFPTVHRILSKSEESDGWPLGPNQMFIDAAVWATDKGNPWMFYEGDCVAMWPGWVDDLQNDYDRQGSGILGDVVKSSGERNPEDKKVLINGAAIYPANLLARCPLAKGLDAYNEWYRSRKSQPMSWDCYCRFEFMKIGKATPLIKSYWKSENYRRNEGNIVFDYTTTEECPDTQHFNRLVSPLAAVVHGSKDGSLHRMILGDVPEPVVPVVTPEPEKPAIQKEPVPNAPIPDAPPKRTRGRSAMKKGRKLNLSAEERKARSERAKKNLKGRARK